MVSSHVHNLDLRCKQTFEIFFFAAVIQRDTVHYSSHTQVMRVFESHIGTFLSILNVDTQPNQTTLHGYTSSREQVDVTSG